MLGSRAKKARLDVLYRSMGIRMTTIGIVGLNSARDNGPKKKRKKEEEDGRRLDTERYKKERELPSYYTVNQVLSKIVKHNSMRHDPSRLHFDGQCYL